MIILNPDDDPDKLWRYGVYRTPTEYTFEAKVYGAPSHFGISGSNVSKLRVWKSCGVEREERYGYDRGLYLEPVDSVVAHVVDDIVAFFMAEIDG